MDSLSVRAAAKLNLFLHIHGRRSDGYHLLESLVVFTSLADTLHITTAPDLTLAVTGAFARDTGDGQDNLVLKAAHTLREKTGCRLGAALRLEKDIPVGAGLGGGSADAAAALKGLNDFWQLGLSADSLHAIAIPLGADVAMCLQGVSALVRGIGDEVIPLAKPLPELYAVLAHPRLPLLTKDVYGAFVPGSAMPSWTSEEWTHAAHLMDALSTTRNDLQSAARTVNAQVGEVLHALETLQPSAAMIRMTGSGACCFALYTEKPDTEIAAALLARQHPQWWVETVRIKP